MRVPPPTFLVIAAVTLAASASAGAQSAAPAPGVRVTPTFSWRVRAESWDWFDDGPAGEYAFVGSHARAGLVATRRRLEWRAELAAPVLLGLPDDAVQPAPAGQLGLGGTYYAVNGGRRDAAGLFVKQLSVRLGDANRGLRLGRFEFTDVGPHAAADPALAALRAQRVGQRLIGPFGFTHGQRSVDGLSATRLGARGRVTLTAVRPTAGVFDVDGARSLPVDVVHLTWDPVGGRFARGADRQWFVLHVADRRGTVPVDARPAAVRAAAPRGVHVTTLGGHRARRFGEGRVQGDVLLWGAMQFGRWGGLDQRAGALALEGALRFPRAPWSPQVRAGVQQGSGDDDAGDGTHRTFHQALPTPRAYARFPFHNLMNAREAFVTVDARPRPTLTLRAGAHALRLADAADLWYLGGGAFDRAVFGYQGRPSGGATALARVLELSAEWRPSPRLSVELFGAQAAAGDVIAGIHGGRHPGRLLYLETTVRR